MREQIRAVYDCGYDEWLLWDAACTYDWEGLLTPEAASEEDERIAASRAQLPETTYAPEETGHDALTVTGGEDLAGKSFPAARALSEAMETAEEPGTPPETGTTLPPTV